MKFEALRRSLVRWLRPPATSVSPKIEPWAELKLMGATYDFDRPRPTESPTPPRPGIKPPPDPAVDRDWRWSEWVRERHAFSLPGWTYCRFPIQYPGDRAVFVFGMVRENFGIYPSMVDVHYTERATKAEHLMSTLVHMASGTSMGIFTCSHLAAQAVDVAEKINVRWADVTGGLEADIITAAVIHAWHDVGIVPTPHAYATRGTNPMPWIIYSHSTEALMEGRPEKLS